MFESLALFAMLATAQAGSADDQASIPHSDLAGYQIKEANDECGIQIDANNRLELTSLSSIDRETIYDVLVYRTRDRVSQPVGTNLRDLFGQRRFNGRVVSARNGWTYIAV
jgi:hypothetical protein